MDVPSHADVVDLIDRFLHRHSMKPTRLGRDAIGEPSFVKTVRDGRMPNVPTLAKLGEFMRLRDEQLSIASNHNAANGPAHRLSSEPR